jgi:transposase
MEKVTLTLKEQKRLKVLNEIEAGRMTIGEAAELMRVSERQVYRLKKAYREKGAAGLTHGNRGRPSPRATSPEVKAAVIELVKQSYRDYNNQHVKEKLEEEHQIVVSVATVRRIRLEAGVVSPRKRRAPKHRQRRERYPVEGLLVQTDASLHDWLEGRGPPLALITYIDDATNEVTGAVFREQEDAAGYMMGLWQTTEQKGLPCGLYTDRRNVFQNPKEPTIEQQLAGKQPTSQFKRALDELDMVLIQAYSPQAKGRIERLFATLQDRLVKALREANACTLEEANRVLQDFLPRFNARFAKEAAQPGSAYRPWPADLRPSDVFCFKYSRVVANDNAISFAGHKLPIPPGPARRSYARARVEVRHHLDGRLSVHYHHQQVAVFDPADDAPLRVGHFTPASLPQPPHPVQTVILARAARPESPPAQPFKPPPDHPWRRSFKRGVSHAKEPY